MYHNAIIQRSYRSIDKYYHLWVVFLQQKKQDRDERKGQIEEKKKQKEEEELIAIIKVGMYKRSENVLWQCYYIVCV